MLYLYLSGKGSNMKKAKGKVTKKKVVKQGKGKVAPKAKAKVKKVKVVMPEVEIVDRDVTAEEVAILEKVGIVSKENSYKDALDGPEVAKAVGGDEG